MKSERGTALFLILLAVVLFAALSYAVTNSMPGDGKDGSTESAAARAADLVGYATSIQQAITRMRLVNNCKDTDISFETSQSGYDYSHTPAVQARCKVYDPAGGNIPYRVEKKWYLPDTNMASWIPWMWWNTGDQAITNIGTSKAELIIATVLIDYEVCRAINKSVGITYTGDMPPLNTGTGLNDVFTGTYVDSNTALGGPYAGKPYACVGHSDPLTNPPMFYFVVIER